MQYYITIEQSKKLVELGLNPDTADMCYSTFGVEAHPLHLMMENKEKFTPCWSLGALIKIMPSLISYGQYDSTLVIYKYGEYQVCYQNMHHLDEVWYVKECLLDAAFEMVCWLLEKGYIKKGE